jgi:tetratricopeptide (TPR) repeat protein
MRVQLIDPITREAAAAAALHLIRRLDEAESLITQAHLFFARREYHKAEPLYWRALQVKRESLGADHGEVAACLENLADLYEIQRHYDDAIRTYECAVEVKRKILGLDHPEVFRSAKRLARLRSAAKMRGKAAGLEAFPNHISLT